MDYDENNLQSQNFQIVGEDNKFPASLQSFALPKFDIDEHLRLDNLVDSEALLGIQGQGNNWIDFSTGSSTIEFNSTAAECCSISRHDNVWSEATSSESVEMLLKSVGDEEVIIKKAVTMESSANDGSHGVDNSTRIIVEDDMSANQFLQKSDALVMLNEKHSDSEFTDRLLVNISCQDKSLKDDNVLHDNFFGKEEQMIPFSKEQDTDFEHNTVDIHCNAISKMSNLGEGCRNISCEQPCNSMEDDGVHHGRNSSIKNAVSSDYGSGNFDSCMDAIDKNPGPHDQLVGSSNDDVEDANQFLTVSHTSAHVIHGTQELKDFQRLSSRPLGFSSEKFESAVEGNSIEDIGDRPEVKVDENKDKAPDECSLHSAVSDVESKKSSVQCLNPQLIDADGVSIVMEKVQDTPPACLQAAKEVSLNCSSPSKLVQEELVSVDSEKSVHTHLPSLEDNFDADAVITKDPKTQSLYTSTVIRSDEKDFSGVPAPLLPIDLVPKKATDLSSKHPTASSSQDDSGMKLPCKFKITNSSLSQETLGSILVIEQKEDQSSSCLSVRDFFSSEENETKCPQGSGLFESGIGQGEDNLKRIGIGSHCPKDALINISTEDHEHTIVQPLCSAQRTDHTCQNEVPSSTGVTVGNGSSLQQEGNDIGHGSPMEGKGEALLQFEACSGVRTDSFISDSNLNNHGNDSYQICTVQSGNPSSSEHNCGSPTVICCRACPEDAGDKEQNGSLIGCTLDVSGNMALVSCENVGIKVDSSSHVSKQTVTTDKDRGFTSEVSTSGDFPVKRTEGEWKSLPSSQSTDSTRQEKSQGFSEEKKELDFPTKTSNEGKSRDASRNSTEKKVGSKRKTKKEASASKSSEMDVKYFTCTTKSFGPLSKDMQFVEMQGSSTDSSAVKITSLLPVQTSSIPDLNSTSSLASFQQPFTDIQQVQLRAQIFAYGALISGMPPDEAYMVSAFGDTDGGRNLWENVWLASVARCRNLNSPIGAIWVPEQVSKGNDVQTEVPSISTTKISISSDVLSSTVPLPSTLLSTSGEGLPTNMSRGTLLDFNQTTSPLCPYRPSLSSQYAGVNSPWLSQSPRPGPWFASNHSSALSVIKQHSTAPAAETLNITPARDFCGPRLPSIQVVSPGILVSNVGTPTLNTEPSSQVEIATTTVDSGNNKYRSTSHKARKRKKDTIPEKPSLSACQTVGQSVSAVSNVKKLALPSPNLPLSSNLSVRITGGAPVSTTMANIISPAHYQIICDNNNSNNQQRAIFSEETCNKIEQSRQQAEDAAAVAASTVKHSQAIWSQLATQKNSGLVSEIEEKLASAAVAAAAAASVAKAAAAAAKVACDAALQAKIMADEAINVTKLSISIQRQECGTLDVGKKLTGLTSISILKGKDNIHGSSAFISAAREAARLRVESAYAATKRAENLDAIVKAAELAAEAVAQAGTIISMGDPLPFTLSELVDTGSEGFWKTHHFTSTKLIESSSLQVEEHSGLQSAKELDGSAKKCDEHFRNVDKTDSGLPGSKELDNAKQCDVHFRNVKETEKTANKETLSSLNEIHQQIDGTSQGNLLNAEHESDHSLNLSSIQRGSIVEVMSDEACLRGAWFSARVLDIKDNKVYVCYKDVSSNEGELKEWIVLESELGKRPRIRIPHSTTAVKYEGTRKRRREHLGSYLFEVGDQVDAWIHDRWWEGSVAEKCPGDQTKLIVQFPARGDKQVVQAWNLRPSLIWNNGQWMEWSLLREKLVKPLEGDTPQVKRQRLGSLEATTQLAVDVGGISKHSINIQSRKPEDLESLNLSAKDVTFSIGQNASEQSTSDILKIKRTGLQKEGSRVVFGIPRPGKKRKFMDVSRHYVADKSENTTKGHDSMKFTKYLMPQASRLSRNSTKVDTKGKKNAENKSKGAVKADSSKSLQTRSRTEKDNALSITFNGEHAAQASAASSFTGTRNSLKKMDTFGVGSFPNNAELTDVPVVESDSSMQPAPTVHLSKGKKAPSSEMELAVKGKSTLDRTSKTDDRIHENFGKEISETIEPRRSNRRIQPTSRLLESLQSSLIIPKIPSNAHERKVLRGGSSSRGNTLN